MKEIPILLYHNIGEYPHEMMEDGMLPETFETQMKFLAENDYNVVTPGEALDHMNGRLTLPPKSIAITIDGGYQDAFVNALPILNRHQMHATFFIPPEYVGKERSIKDRPIKCLSWEEVRQIRRNGMEIGLLAYHGRSIRTHYDEDAIKRSVLDSMKIMIQKIDGPISFCAFKEGVPRKSLWKFLQAQGFSAVFTQCPTNRRASVDGIGRIQVDDDDSNIFLTKVSQTYLFFKDKRSWKYVRKYRIDRVAHHVSETLNKIRGNDG